MANRFDDKVASVSKALTILEELSKVPEGMGLVEISNKVGMNKTTVYRLLTSLLEKEFVEQDETTGKYSLGLKILGIASALYRKMDIRAIVRNHAAELFPDFQGTLLVTKELNQEYMVVDLIKAGAGDDLGLQAGEMIEGALAIPKAFMANAALWRQGRGMNQVNSLREDALLRQELKQIAVQGYAEAFSDLGELPAVAAPVFNFSKNVVYVISLHSSKLKEKKIQADWILKLLELANRISGDFGFVNYS